MKLEDIVCPMEQSEKLIALGVRIETALVWVRNPNFDEEAGEKDYNVTINDVWAYEMSCLDPAPAFTATELLELMPKAINIHLQDGTKAKNDHRLYFGHTNNGQYYARYETGFARKGYSKQDKTLAGALSKLLIFALESNFIIIEEVNNDH